jgi:hypothetical protein
MRTGSIGTTTTLATLAVLLLGCDIGARTRVETLCSAGPSGYCQSPMTSIALDATTIYWTEATTVDDAVIWSMKSVPKNALPPAPPAQLGSGQFITAETTEQGSMLWFAEPSGAVSRRDPGPEGIVTPMFSPADATAVGLVRDGDNLYEAITIGNPQTEWQIWQIPRDGSAPLMLASEATDALTPLDLTTDGTHVYFSLGGPVDQELIGQIRRVAVGTTDVEMVASEIHRPQVLREFGDNLFWYEVEEIQGDGLMKGRLQRSPKESGGSQVLASITGQTSLSVDESFVYWVDLGADRVWVERIPQSNSSPITSMVLLEPAGPSRAIANDETYVYWSDEGTPYPALNRMLKK